MNDENPFGATPKGQPDSIITTKDGEIITISWTNPCFNSGSVGVPKYGSSLGPVFENEDGGDEDFQYIPPTEMSMSEDVEEEEDSVFDSQDLESSDGEGVVLYRRK